MLRRTVVFTFSLIAFSSCSLAQNGFPQSIGGFPQSQRPGSQPSAQEMFNNLSGTVVTTDNHPLKDVVVELRDTSGATVGTVYTNSSGMFEFPAVRAGIYDVVATAGLEQAQERVQIERMPSAVNLRMPISSRPTDGNPANSVSVAQYKVPAKARDEFKAAREASAKGKNDVAEKHLSKALDIYPKYADAITLRAILKVDANDHQGAIADLQQAITYDENCAMAYMVMGAALNMELKFDDAIRALQHGESLAPNAWQPYFEMGRALVGKAQYEPALRQLDKAQSLVQKDYPLIHLVKAHAMFGLNNYSDAMTELQAYLDKVPQGPNSEEAQKLLARARAFAANNGAK